MKAYRVVRYDATLHQTWNDFIESAKNATFLFHRDFMDYHSDRFEDYSVLIYENDELKGLLPANKKEDTVYTHQGLSYGGLVVKEKLKFQTYIQLFEKLLVFLESEGINILYWKEFPAIYSAAPSSEWRYVMSILKARLDYTDLLSTIDKNSDIDISSDRIKGLKRGRKHGLVVREENDLYKFWTGILTPNLKNRYNVAPVHALSEIELLKSRFPRNIRQFNVYKDQHLVAGTTIFETPKVAHVQYISADEKRSALGSLDFLFHYLITKVFRDKPYFDFGTSNESKGQHLNKGLLYWKEGFGARTVTQDFYKIETKNHLLLKDVLR